MPLKFKDGHMSEPINNELAALIKIASNSNAKLQEAEKTGFVDPAMAGGGGAPPGMPPGGAMDPMAGAMPPMPPMGGDPAAMGGDPAMMGADPMMGGGGLTEDRVLQMIQENAAGGAAGAGGAGGAGTDAAGKKKVDVNTEIYHVKKLLVYLLENLGLNVPPTMLLGDPAEDPQAAPEEVSGDPASAGASPESAIQPIQALQGASQQMAGPAEEAPPKAASAGLLSMAGQAAAQSRVLQAHNG
jgi:hypothetical protein